MRILSIVTLVSPHGEYGGPLRVALNQSLALMDRGHEVTLAGAYRGYRSPPTSCEGVPARLFPATNIVPRSGFSGLSAPRLLSWLGRSAGKFDVVHIHAGRDLVTLPSARIVAMKGLRYVVQTHGMIDQSDRMLAKPLDALLTLPVLKHAHRVLILTDDEGRDLEAVVGQNHMRFVQVPNGVPTTTIVATRDRAEPEVLYLARLAPRKRPLAFVRAAIALQPEFPAAKFTLVGPDEGEGGAVSNEIEAARSRGVQLSWEGPLAPAHTIERMSRASIYVLPAVNEPYPMTVLEAMSVGLPVVVTHSCGLAPFVANAGGGIVVDVDEESLIGAIRSLLSRPEDARDLGESGRAAVRVERSMNSIALALEDAYAD